MNEERLRGRRSAGTSRSADRGIEPCVDVKSDDGIVEDLIPPMADAPCLADLPWKPPGRATLLVRCQPKGGVRFPFKRGREKNDPVAHDREQEIVLESLFRCAVILIRHAGSLLAFTLLTRKGIDRKAERRNCQEKANNKRPAVRIWTAGREIFLGNVIN